MKLITMIGSFRLSVPYYFGKVLTNLKAKTLVIDNTDGNFLFNTLKHDKADDFIKRNNTIVLKNRLYNEEWFNKFDYCIVMYGTDEAVYEEAVFERTDCLIAMTDYERNSTEVFKSVLESIYNLNSSFLSTRKSDKTQRQIFSIWKDKSCNKIHEKDVESKCRLATTKRYTLPLTTQNSKAYEALTYNGTGKLSPLDKTYKTCLFEITDSVTDKKHTKALRKMLR